MNDGALTITLDQLFSSEPACRTMLDRTLQLISAEREIPYLDALTMLERGCDGARATGGDTLADALKWLQADAGYIDETLLMLDRRDRLVSAAAEQAAGTETTDPYGRVLLDADQRRKGTAQQLQTSGGVDIAQALADPVQSEARYQRIRQSEPGRWDGPQGRNEFASTDRQYLEAGYDLVATAERGARAPADRVAGKLDAAIAKAGAKRAKLRQLSQQIDPTWPASVRAATLAELEAKMGRVNSKALKLLDRAEGDLAGELKLLDKQARKGAKRATSPVPPPTPALRLLDGGQGPPQAAPAAPPSLGNADVDAQVRARMAALGAQDGDYVKVLEQILGE